MLAHGFLCSVMPIGIARFLCTLLTMQVASLQRVYQASCGSDTSNIDPQMLALCQSALLFAVAILDLFPLYC
jgi:hypothetical protein